jgi:hypothetical protein
MIPPLPAAAPAIFTYYVKMPHRACRWHFHVIRENENTAGTGGEAGGAP